MDEDEEKSKEHKLWLLRRKGYYLKRERPLIFNSYDVDSGKWISSSTEELPPDELKDPTKRIAFADLDHEIAKIDRAIKELEEEFLKERLSKGKNHNKTADELINDGFHCICEGRYREAIEVCKQAIELDPGHEDAFRHLGIAYANTGQYQKAKDAFKQAVKIDPYYRDAYCYLALIYSELDMHESALETCQHAIELKPEPECPTLGYAFAYFCLGIIYCNYGNFGLYDEAIEAFEQATKLRPYYREAYVCLGIAYEYDYRVLEKSIDGHLYHDRRHDYFDPYPALDGIYRRLGMNKEAIDYLKESIKTTPDAASSLTILGDTYSKLVMYKEAIDIYEHAIKLNPNHAKANYGLGFAYAKIRQQGKALAQYKVLINLNPDLAEKLFYEIYR
jgi:tetratricopeptide (TPR) repeat protein